MTSAQVLCSATTNAQAGSVLVRLYEPPPPPGPRRLGPELARRDLHASLDALRQAPQTSDPFPPSHFHAFPGLQRPHSPT